MPRTDRTGKSPICPAAWARFLLPRGEHYPWVLPTARVVSFSSVPAARWPAPAEPAPSNTRASNVEQEPPAPGHWAESPATRHGRLKRCLYHCKSSRQSAAGFSGYNTDPQKTRCHRIGKATNPHQPELRLRQRALYQLEARLEPVRRVNEAVVFMARRIDDQRVGKTEMMFGLGRVNR